MNKETVLDLMGLIDPALVEEADSIQTNTRRSKLIPVAVLVAAAVLLMGAAGVLWRFHLLTGAGVIQDEHQLSVDHSESDPPAQLEDGRLIFTADGQHIDITDLIDQRTAYVYATVNAGLPTYIMVGGTPEDFGYAEVWVDRGEVGVAIQYGEYSTMIRLTPENFRKERWRTAVQGAAWFITAMEEIAPEIEDYLPDDG